ncbi:hypothetical protein BDW60DRAFT_208713 [Aspergillus nidulans var. acristatus]
MATINTTLVVRVADNQSPKLSKENIDIPRPAENQVLIKVSHVAQRQSFDGRAFGDGAVLGCDYMGEVVELGSGVTRLAKGDIAAALVPSSPERRQQHYRRVNLFLRLPLDDHKLASELVEQSPAWLENGTNKSSNHRALQGLDAVPDGFQEYRDGKISLTRLSMNRLSSMSSDGLQTFQTAI